MVQHPILCFHHQFPHLSFKTQKTQPLCRKKIQTLLLGNNNDPSISCVFAYNEAEDHNLLIFRLKVEKETVSLFLGFFLF